MIQRETCLELIGRTLGKKRRFHSVCVAQQAVRLARLYGADPEKAEIAGLLHDVMKEYPRERTLEELSRRGVRVDPVTAELPQLWHAVLGEAYIRQELGETDRELLRAVRYHTTGCAGMTLFEEIIYLADFTSSDRDYPDADKMRRIVDRSLDAAFREALRFTIMKFSEMRQPIHPDSLSAYNEVLTRNPPPELRL